jgi:hypothetical protein
LRFRFSAKHKKPVARIEWPSSTNLNSITGNECTYGDLNAIIGKDQSGVGDSELGGRHFVDGVVLTGLGVLKMKMGRERRERSVSSKAYPNRVTGPAVCGKKPSLRALPNSV